MAKIKNCPVCKLQPELSDYYISTEAGPGRRYMIECKCGTKGKEYKSAATAKRAWNKGTGVVVVKAPAEDKKSKKGVMDMKNIKEAEVVTASNMPIVRPAISAMEAKQVWKEYQEFKTTVVEPSDIQKIQGRDFLKKSYWRKIEKFFNLDLELVREEEKSLKILVKKGAYGKSEIEYYPMEADIDANPGEQIKNTIVFSVIYRAIAPNGCFADADGHCDIWEKGRANSYHNAKAAAHTRAKNRAISDLVGGGEVSAEEMHGYGVSQVKNMVQNRVQSSQPKRNQQQARQNTKIVSKEQSSTVNKAISENQKSTLMDLIKNYSLDFDSIHKWMLEKLGANSLADLQQKDYNTLKQKVEQIVEHARPLEIEIELIEKRLDCEKHGIVSFADRVNDYVQRKYKVDLYGMNAEQCKFMSEQLPAFEQTVLQNIDEKLKDKVEELGN